MEHKANNAPADVRWLFIDMNSFFASCEQQDDPRLRGRAVIVVPGMTDSTCAIAASYEAKAFGIKTGTNVGDAKAACRDLVVVQARHDIYTRYHNLVMDEVNQHTPLTKIWSIDEAACRLQDRDCNEASAVALARRIKAGIAENVGICLRSSIGIAPNGYLAKIASNMQKPDGLTVLRAQDLPGRLFDLALSDLIGVGPSMLARLNRAGIWSVRELWDVPPKHMRAIWRSVEGERFWNNLHGLQTVDRPTEKSVVGHSRILDPAARVPEVAADVARGLTVKACQRLRRYNMLASGFSLSVRDTDGRRWAREVKLDGAQDSLTFARLLGALWRQMMAEMRPYRLRKVSISLFRLQPMAQSTGDLFNDNWAGRTRTKARVSSEALSNGMDALNRKFGAGTVQFGLAPQTNAGFVGTKIAFSRVPDMAEFEE